MSFENFQLSPILMQELYKNTLVDLDNEQIIQQSLNTATISSLGKNERQILVLTREEGTAHIHDENLGFLLGILKACQLGMQDIALVNLAGKEPLDYKILTQHFSPVQIIGFGIMPTDIGLPIHFPHYQLQSFNNQQYLMSPSFAVLAGNQEEKRSLWNALRKMFSL
ncbi:MAG: hypothetical protein U0T56_05960 [Ferruginibacter sp.]|jgi:hypothetical protein